MEFAIHQEVLELSAQIMINVAQIFIALMDYVFQKQKRAMAAIIL
jgi:hypothetical protein